LKNRKSQFEVRVNVSSPKIVIPFVKNYREYKVQSPGLIFNLGDMKVSIDDNSSLIQSKKKSISFTINNVSIEYVK
jgi:hypothetical protein